MALLVVHVDAVLRYAFALDFVHLFKSFSFFAVHLVSESWVEAKM